jgi:hypothetical protein
MEICEEKIETNEPFFRHGRLYQHKVAIGPHLCVITPQEELRLCNLRNGYMWSDAYGTRPTEEPGAEKFWEDVTEQYCLKRVD